MLPMLPEIQRRIVNAKYVLERAAGIQAENNEMSISISLLLMHDSIELLMSAVRDHLNTGMGRDFMSFWDDITKAKYAKPPDQVPMMRLNKLRVALKHHGIAPNPQSVREMLPRAMGFFENVLTLYCNMTYADVSMIDLIPNQEIRVILTAARQKFTDGDKPGAMTDLKVALHKLEYPYGKRLPKLYAPRMPRLTGELERSGLGEYMKQLHSFLEACASRTNALMFGIDPIRYANFVRQGPGVVWASNGSHQAQHWSTYGDVTSEMFEELVLFLIDYSLLVNAAYISATPTLVRNALGVSLE